LTKRLFMNQENAEILALKSLAFLASDPDALGRFLTLTGTSGAELQHRAEDPEFLAALLDFLMTDEPLVAAFCQAESLDAQRLHSARRALPGG
jgi:hypothetical protein